MSNPDAFLNSQVPTPDTPVVPEEPALPEEEDAVEGQSVEPTPDPTFPTDTREALR